DYSRPVYHRAKESISGRACSPLVLS
ncbi:unnamed protein product, partial [Oikopleura dioica]